MSENSLVEVPIEAIDRCPYQPRRTFNEQEIEQLANSIGELGLIQPIIVRKSVGNRFELIAGERRWRACQKAGLRLIPVVVREDSNTTAASAALVENIQRVDLNPIEIALGLQRLVDLESLSQEQVAERVGKKRSTVANFLRLLSLPEKVQTGLQAGKISMGHAKVILSLEGSAKQEALYTKILSRGLSVRETEMAALQMANRSLPKQRVMPLGQDEHLTALGEALQRRFGTKAKVTGSKQGKIVLEYHSLDDLDRILEELGVEVD